MKLTTQLYIFLITVLAVCLYIQFKDDRNSVYCVEEEVTADTVVIFRTDTITEYVFKEVEKRTIDTVYIETENKPFLALPVVSKRFAKENLYDLWISGVEPLKMDSLRLYPQSKQETIVITKETHNISKTTDLFANVGIISFDGVLAPKIGISLKTKKERLYGLEIGSYDGKMFYGVNVGIKINK